jgi:hypothetical protein
MFLRHSIEFPEGRFGKFSQNYNIKLILAAVSTKQVPRDMNATLLCCWPQSKTEKPYYLSLIILSTLLKNGDEEEERNGNSPQVIYMRFSSLVHSVIFDKIHVLAYCFETRLNTHYGNNQLPSWNRKVRSTESCLTRLFVILSFHLGIDEILWESVRRKRPKCPRLSA